MSETPAISILYDPVTRMVCPFCRNRMDVAGLKAFTKAICPTCKHEVPVPARLGAFLLLELLGTGGMGGVYRAHDETLGRDVAIKVMLKSLGDNQEFVHTFRREAQAAAKLNHPHIAQIYSFGQEKGQPYIVMELVPGKHFDTMIAGPEPLDPAFVMKVGADIAEGLQVASEAGLVHGDIKPENILLDERDQAKLVDFGIAGNVNQSQGEIWGTPYYIAPEKVRRQRIDHRSDIYCLGGTLYHALTGHPPFEGADAVEVVKARFKGPPEPLDKKRSDLTPELVAIISRMLQVEPAMRYPTYESLLGDMRRYLRGVAPASHVVGGKKIMIKGRTGKSTTGAGVTASVTGSLSATARHKSLMVTRGLTGSETAAVPDVAGAAGGNGAAAPSKQGARRKGCLVAGLVTLGVLLVGGLAVGGFLAYQKKQRDALQTAAAQQRAAAINQLTGYARDIAGLRQKLDAYAAQGKEAVDESVRLVVQELGEDVRPQLELPPDPDPAAAGDTNAVAEAAVPAEEEQLPPLVQQAREVAMHGRPLRQAVTRSQQIAAIVDEYVAQAQVATNTTAAIETYGLRAQRLRDDVNGYVTGRAPEWVRNTQEKLETIRRTVAAGTAERERRAAQQRAEEEARRQEAERLRKEEEARALREADLTKVREAEAAQRDALRRNAYAEALRGIRSIGDDLKTEEGRKAHATTMARIQRLDELKSYLVQRLNEGKFRASAGWTVTAATARHVTVRSASGRVEEVPWEKISVGQMAPFILHYLLDEQQAGQLKLRERVRQSTNAAVYCMLVGEGSEAARGMATRLVEKALELFPDAADDVRELLPDFLPRE